MTNKLMLLPGDRVKFVYQRIKDVNFPRIGMRGKVQINDSQEGILVVWDDGKRPCWCYRDELRKLPERKVRA